MRPTLSKSLSMDDTTVRSTQMTSNTGACSSSSTNGKLLDVASIVAWSTWLGTTVLSGVSPAMAWALYCLIVGAMISRKAWRRAVFLITRTFQP